MDYRKLIFFTTLGSSLEFFDFTIYALFAGYISKAFFPTDTHTLALIHTFGIFAVGYLARPVGAVIFGYIGDRYGRRNTFALTVLLMSLATLMTGIIPSYQHIGIAAPILLLLFRLIQGLSLGGEVAGSSVFLAEHMDTHRRGFGIGIIFAGLTAGNILASSVGAVLSSLLADEIMSTFGWRIPFILGCLLGIISYYIRKQALESPIFERLIASDSARTAPLSVLMRLAPKQLLQGTCVTALIAGAIFTLLYLPNYYQNILGISLQNSYVITIWNFGWLVLSCVGFAYVSDYFGRKSLIILSCILTIICGYPLFLCLSLYTSSFIWWFGVVFGLMIGLINSTFGCKLIELFPTCVRYSGMALSYNIGFAIFGGLAPFINGTLSHWLEDGFSLYYYLAFVAIISLVSTLFTADRTKESLAF